MKMDEKRGLAHFPQVTGKWSDAEVEVNKFRGSGKPRDSREVGHSYKIACLVSHVDGKVGWKALMLGFQFNSITPPPKAGEAPGQTPCHTCGVPELEREESHREATEM